MENGLKEDITEVSFIADCIIPIALHSLYLGPNPSILFCPPSHCTLIGKKKKIVSIFFVLIYSSTAHGRARRFYVILYKTHYWG